MPELYDTKNNNNMPVQALIPAAVAAASSIANIASQNSMNKATREWNERMYAMQRNDALIDWNRQNEYNSPAAQMARFKAAGLNPNLIYGQTNEAPAVRSTDVKSWNPQAPDYSGIGSAAMSGLASYQDMTMQNEQLKNMNAQRTNMQLDAVLKTADIAAKNLNNAKNLALFDTSMETAKELLRSLQVGTDIKVSKEVRDAALHAPNLAAAFERVANISANTSLARAQLENLKRSGILQGMEIDLRKLGMSWNDPIWARMLAQFAEGKPLPDLVKDLYRGLRDSFDGFIPSIFPKQTGTFFDKLPAGTRGRLDSLNRGLNPYGKKR